MKERLTLQEMFMQFSDNLTASRKDFLKRIKASSLDDKVKDALIRFADELYPLNVKTLPIYKIEDDEFYVNEDGRAYMRCPECGKPTLPDYEFCPYCGIKLDMSRYQLCDLTPEERGIRRIVRRRTRPGLGIPRRFRGNFPITFKKVKVNVPTNKTEVKAREDDPIIVSDDDVGTIRWSDIRETMRNLKKYI